MIRVLLIVSLAALGCSTDEASPQSGQLGHEGMKGKENTPMGVGDMVMPMGGGAGKAVHLIDNLSGEDLGILIDIFGLTYSEKLKGLAYHHQQKFLATHYYYSEPDCTGKAYMEDLRTRTLGARTDEGMTQMAVTNDIHSRQSVAPSWRPSWGQDDLSGQYRRSNEAR